jgi:hypothetical protein
MSQTTRINGLLYRDYRAYWQGHADNQVRANLTARYPESGAYMTPVHYEILGRFIEATCGASEVTVSGATQWAEPPEPRIVEAVEVARMTGCSFLAVGWSEGKPRLDVVWGDQITVTPDTARSLDSAVSVAIVGESGQGVSYLREGNTWTLRVDQGLGMVPMQSFEALPVMAIYEGRSRPDFAVPDPRTTLLRQQECLDAIATDIEHQRANSPTQLAIKGQDTADTGNRFSVLRRGPEWVLSLQQGEDLQTVPTSLNLQAQVEYLESHLRSLAVMAGLSPTTFLPSRAETGAAKAEEGAENLKVRLRNHQFAVAQARQVEQWLTACLPQPVAVTVPAFQIPSFGDPLQTAQALELRWKMGIDSPVEQAMRERGLTEEQALEFVRRNQSSYRVFGGGTLTPENRRADGTQVAETAQP